MNGGSPVDSQRRFGARIISLRNSVERRGRIANNLDNLATFHWRFFDALREDSVTKLIQDKDSEVRNFGRELTAGEIGCYKSHIELLNEFVESDSYDWLLVLEDDVFVDVRFDFLAIIDLLDSLEIGYLRLYAKRLKPFRLVTQLPDLQLVRFLSDPYGTQAYLISRQSAKCFAAAATVIDMPIDDRMGRFWSNGLIPYAIFPFPIVEITGASTIGTGRSIINDSRAIWSYNRLILRLREKILKTLFNLRLMASRK